MTTEPASTDPWTNEYLKARAVSEPGVTVPAEALKNVIGIVCELVLDGEDETNTLAVWVAKDVMRLQAPLGPDEKTGQLREWLAPMLAVPDHDEVGMRVESARSLLDFYMHDQTGEQDDRESLIDVITNLMHFADRENIDFGSILGTAEAHHDAEAFDEQEEA